MIHSDLLKKLNIQHIKNGILLSKRLCYSRLAGF
ncbi:hypothetical protein PLUTE_a6016 [Pseudoalteromonas luteoviolacea DSM 6061]|nr:hypothetical protein [Pseudoalteromonas luteoviolacea DSM 6061]